jgi:hypothetical protein
LAALRSFCTSWSDASLPAVVGTAVAVEVDVPDTTWLVTARCEQAARELATRTALASAIATRAIT